ncbi:hypothetical protein HN873_012150, partial [Arachis hypogaea]
PSDDFVNACLLIIPPTHEGNRNHVTLVSMKFYFDCRFRNHQMNGYVVGIQTYSCGLWVSTLIVYIIFQIDIYMFVV